MKKNKLVKTSAEETSADRKAKNALLGPFGHEKNLSDAAAMGAAINDILDDPNMHDAALPSEDVSFDDILAELTGGAKPKKVKNKGSEEQELPRKLPRMR